MIQIFFFNCVYVIETHTFLRMTYKVKLLLSIYKLAAVLIRKLYIKKKKKF